MSISTYAKIENDIVTAVHAVTWDFIVANPERYGDPELWLEVFQDGSGRGYCGVGWTYDPNTDTFIQPTVELTDFSSDGN